MDQFVDNKSTSTPGITASSNEIRRQFLEFFQSKGHTIVPSAPIVLKDDPTLLFTNAGMNQFKDYFLGNRQAPFQRAADTQKCLRVSGKHNDLEEVGVDTYHHTMFEMLGNWSFGDYFKPDAIRWSWELLTAVYGLDKDRLYVTIFEGDAPEGLPMDEEALEEWKKYVAPNRIIKGNKKDNFWEMGDTGPCGPCSEIHVDCRGPEEREQVPGNELVNQDHPQVIEIWNNVFMEFNRRKDGKLEPLPARHVDTGMGFERLVRVLQGKQSNYDTDVFSGLIKTVERISGKAYDFSGSKQDIAFRVLADHIRAIGFTIADGQLPSNTGAGYVIRRILRRAVRYAYSYLGYKQALLYQLLPVLAKQFEAVFPELVKQLDFVTKVVREEEDAFLRTLDKGLKRIDEIIHQPQPVKAINGTVAFELYDTYGFPLDLTRLIAAENSLTVDEAGFHHEMKQQKDRSRSAALLDKGDWIPVGDSRESNFVGYDMLECQTRLSKYRKVSSKTKEFYQLVLDSTPFYAESGGQVGDTGTLDFNGEVIAVTNTRKENDLLIHFTDKLPEVFDTTVNAKVNAGRRKEITLHHTATHLMHAALRTVLGSHVAQKGSLVNEEHLRFDFSHFAKLSGREIRDVEQLVNAKIRANIPVVIKTMSKDEAIAMGAMALFGEKYGDQVRVVIMDPAYSIELCGGTHTGSTGELGLFKIKHESAVAAGVRRIEAVCGAAAESYVNQVFDEMDRLRALLKQPKDLQRSIENLWAENSMLSKKVEGLEARQLVVIRNELLQKDEIINNVSFVGEVVEVSSADALKKLCVDLKNHLHDHVVVLCTNIDGKAFVAIGISETVVTARSLDASKITRELVSGLIKGGGGGQATIATAGGQDVSGLRAVIEKIRSLL
jgi:alanyl-tRNA synthetase